MTLSVVNDVSDPGAKEKNFLGPDSNVDGILRSLRPFGKYQLIQTALFILFFLEDAFHLIAIVYIGFRPEYSCQHVNKTNLRSQYKSVLSNVSAFDVKYQKCSIDIRANSSEGLEEISAECINGFNYSIPDDFSTVTEWDLVCSRAEKSELAQTMIMFGQAIGAALFSPLADRFGRKPSNCAARVLYFLTAIATGFAPNIEIFTLLRFLQGTFQGGSVMTLTILQIELLPTSYRHYSERFLMTAWSTGALITTLIGYLCRNIPWVYMQWILGLITFHTVFDWLFVHESIRWLIANGRTVEAETLIRKAAKQNGVDFNDVMKAATPAVELEDKQGQKENDDENKTKVHKYTVFTILKQRTLLGRSAILWFAWITNTITYYGLMLTSNKLSGDRYLNNTLGALAEYPAIIIQQLLINRIGRKWTLIMFHGMAGISMLSAMLCMTYGRDIYWTPHLGTTFSLIGRCAITGSFSTVFIYTPELYPTNLRNAGLGLASTISRVGSMMSPFAMTLADHIEWGPGAVFAAMNVIVTFSLLLLPETMGHNLPTTVSEMNTWQHSNNSCSMFRKKKHYNLKPDDNRF